MESSNIYLITARCHATAISAIVVCVSVTSRCSTETAKRRITQTTPHDSPRDSSFLMPKISAKLTVTANGGTKCRWGRLKLATFDK